MRLHGTRANVCKPEGSSAQRFRLIQPEQVSGAGSPDALVRGPAGTQAKVCKRIRRAVCHGHSRCAFRRAASARTPRRCRSIFFGASRCEVVACSECGAVNGAGAFSPGESPIVLLVIYNNRNLIRDPLCVSRNAKLVLFASCSWGVCAPAHVTRGIYL